MKVDITGNIFFDAGYYLFYHILDGKKYSDKDFSEEECQKIICWLTKETETWLQHPKNKFSPYFLNHPASDSKIPEKKMRAEKVKGKLSKNLTQWRMIDDKPCSVCGQYESISPGLSRVELPLAGSLQGRNFFPQWGEGISVCGICAIKSYATIFSTVNSSGRVILLDSCEPEIMKIWVNEIARNRSIHKQNLLNEQGPITLKIVNKLNVLYLLLNCIADCLDGKTNLNLDMNFVYYTNFAAGADLEIYPVNHELLAFILILHSESLKKEWDKFVYRFYTSSKVSWDEKSQKLFYNDKKSEHPAEENEYHNNRNRVVGKLMTGKPLGLHDFVSNRSLNVCFRVIEIYYEEVLHVEKERISFIKSLAELVADEIKAGRMKLGDLEGAGQYHQFQGFIVRAARKYAASNGKPLIKLDDYINMMLEDWRGNYYLLLIRLYELLAEFLKNNVEDIKINKEDKNEEMEVTQ